MSHAHLIIHTDTKETQAHAEQMIQNLKIHPVDLKRYEGGTFVIAQVRELITFLSRTPFASPVKVVLITAKELTTEAQQALLKTFEEPPPRSLLILTSSSNDTLIPTLVSRCTIIKLQKTEVGIDGSRRTDLSEFWSQLFTLPNVERLKLSTSLIKDKSGLLGWLKEQTTFFHEELLGEHFKLTLFEKGYILRKLTHTHSLVNRNISPKLALDHLFLELPVKRV